MNVNQTGTVFCANTVKLIVSLDLIHGRCIANNIFGYHSIRAASSRLHWLEYFRNQNQASQNGAHTHPLLVIAENRPSRWNVNLFANHCRICLKRHHPKNLAKQIPTIQHFLYAQLSSAPSLIHHP
jgi:hypothetical protein